MLYKLGSLWKGVPCSFINYMTAGGCVTNIIILMKSLKKQEIILLCRTLNLVFFFKTGIKQLTHRMLAVLKSEKNLDSDIMPGVFGYQIKTKHMNI